MARARFWSTVISVVLLGSPLFAQESGKARRPDELGPPREFPAKYAIRARLLVDSCYIRGDWELQYRNFSQDTMRWLAINLPQWMYADTPADMICCKLDSLLVNGTPADVAAQDHGRWARVPLEYPLPPDSSVLLLASFRTFINVFWRTDAEYRMTVLPWWHPTIARYDDHRWLAGDKARKSGWLGEMGWFDVALTVDSSYGLVGPGQLTNAKLLFGAMPSSRTDTLFENVTNWSESEGRGLSPEPKDGLPTYTWRFRSGRTFPIGIGKDLQCDRLISSGHVFDLWRTSGSDTIDVKSLHAAMRKTIAELNDRKVQIPGVITAVVGEFTGPGKAADGLAVVSTDSARNDKKVSRSVVRQIQSWMAATRGKEQE